ncbi:MAG: ParB/RepB/Spo0J family partition protein [Planctomycetota bacterium]
MPIDQIEPNPMQPRRRFDDRRLAELAASIKQAGVMQPIVVRPRPSGGYQIVAGERRWRAARQAGLASVPAVVRELDDRRTAELALIENVQRADLNPIEKAIAFRTLIARFELTQAQVAERVGLDRSSVTNLLRLLDLPDDLQQLIADGSLSAGHGKVLVSVADADARRELAERCIAEQLSVRQVEKLARDAGETKRKPERADSNHNANIARLEEVLGEQLKTKVRIDARGDGTSGRLVLEFYSLEHFDGLLQRLGCSSS